MCLCHAEETDADDSTLGVHWWIMLLAALILMLAIALIVFIVCFVARTRRTQRRQFLAGNNLVRLSVVCMLLFCTVLAVHRLTDEL